MFQWPVSWPDLIRIITHRGGLCTSWLKLIFMLLYLADAKCALDPAALVRWFRFSRAGQIEKAEGETT